MPYVEQYKPGSVVGEQYARLIKLSGSVIGKDQKDDDFILVIAGTAGSGKSSLGLHTYTILDPETCSIDNVALTPQDLAKAFKTAGSRTDGFRYVQYDEGKLNRRDWATEWSKDLLSMYHDIRGKNIYHVWCTAMPNMIDREFVDSRVKGFVFVYSKGKFARRFLYFTKGDLLRFMEANDNKISIKLLNKHGASFARLDSYFLKYTGPLWAAYADKKDDRMDQRIDEFYEKYADESTNLTRFSKEQRVDLKTADKWFKYGVEAALLKEDEHFKTNGLGAVTLNKKGQDQLVFIMKTYSKRGPSRILPEVPSNDYLFNARQEKKDDELRLKPLSNAHSGRSVADFVRSARETISDGVLRVRDVVEIKTRQGSGDEGGDLV